MASIEDRWFRKSDGEKSARHGKGMRWLLRWRDLDSAEGKLSFAKWKDADNKRKEIEGDMLRGSYVDPKAGRQTFDEFAAEWVAQRTSDPLTIQETKARLKRYVTGTPLGKSPLGKIRPSTVQAWIKSLTVADSTARVVFDHVSSIFAAAVDDGAIGNNPCSSKSVTPPKRVRGKIIPWTHERVGAVLASIAERYRPLVVVGAGLGLRPGEAYGLSPDDVDWLRGSVTIRRQVKLVGNRRVFAPPKGGKDRSVPLPDSVRDELAAYLAAYPAKDVALPWREPGGKETTVKLLVTNEQGRALHSRSTTAAVWYPALDAAGVPRDRTNGAHALRHYFASAALADSGDIKAIAEYLGHSDAGFTLRTYTHLMPSAETRIRSAIDKAFREASSSSRAPTVPRTAT